MYKWENAILTTKGKALLAKLTSGHTLSLVRAVTGAGYISPDILKYQTGVTDEMQALSFATQSYPEKGTCAVPVRLFNTGISVGYTAKQIGIYAMDPDEGEILFLIAQSNGVGTDIPSESEMPGYSAEWTFYLQYGQADGVNVTVDPANTVNEERVRSIIDDTVTPEWLGLGNVDNTADSEKNVAFASVAAAARKVNYSLVVRLKGGQTEGTDMWTYDGSTSKSMNITPEKIEAAPAIESPDHFGCYYRMVAGQQEWLNPPLQLNVEYCTTERKMTMPVYTMLVRIGAVEPGDSKIIDILPSAGEYTVCPIRCSAHAYMMTMKDLEGNDMDLVHGRTLGGLGFVVDAFDNTISYSMPSTVDRTYYVDVQVWYIKEY